jgi:hypothetical protein
MVQLIQWYWLTDDGQILTYEDPMDWAWLWE